MVISRYTKPELERFLALCNFTKDEAELFGYRAKDVSLEACAELMNTSVSTANRLSKRVSDKIKRIS